MSFNFQMPTHIIFGRGEIKKLCKCRKYGDRALVVTGKLSSKKFGYLDKIIKILNNLGMSCFVYDNISQNPNCISVDEGVNVSIKNNCNLIIALGGGSVIDVAKGIAVGSVELAQIWDFLRPDSRRRTVRGALPVIAIPTTAGSGSETTGAAYIQNDEIGFKTFFKSNFTFPKLSIIDPELMVSLPNEMRVFSGINTFCQALECYMGIKSNEMGNLYALKAIELVYFNLKKACINLDDVDSIEKLAFSSVLGGIAASQSDTSFIHAIVAPLSGHYNITHGVGLAALLPAIIELSLESNSIKYKTLAKLLSGNEVNHEHFLILVKDFLKSFGLEVRLRDLNIKKDDFEKLSKESAMTFAGCTENFNKEIDENYCRKVYEMSY